MDDLTMKLKRQGDQVCDCAEDLFHVLNLKPTDQHYLGHVRPKEVKACRRGRKVRESKGSFMLEERHTEEILSSSKKACSLRRRAKTALERKRL